MQNGHMCPCYCRNGPCCCCPAASACGDSACSASDCEAYDLCAFGTSACAAVGSSGGWCGHGHSWRLCFSDACSSVLWLYFGVCCCRHFFVALSQNQFMRSIASRSYCNNKKNNLCDWEVAWLNAKCVLVRCAILIRLLPVQRTVLLRLLLVLRRALLFRLLRVWHP